MGKSKIEWTDRTWNPVTGCTKISPGCANCYAERMAKRLAGRCGYPADEPFRVTLHRGRLEEPFRWRKPSRVFVCSMGDLFHEEVPASFIGKVFETIACCPEHTFLILTKRPKRMAEFIGRYSRDGGPLGNYTHNFPHVWLGVTAENQEQADKRIPVLLQIPAAVRFVSVEPMLGPVNLTRINLGVQKTRGYGSRQIIWDALSGWEKQYETNRSLRSMFQQTPKCMSNDIGGRLNWVICGGETGPGARPCHPDWVRSLRDQCVASGTPFFFKSWGMWIPSYDAGERCDETDQYGRSFGKCWSQGKTYYRFPDGQGMVRVGKKRAGRLLDGRTWDEVPEVAG